MTTLNNPMDSIAKEVHACMSQGFSGIVTITLELSQGGLRACHFGTNKRIHPIERGKESPIVTKK